MGCIKGPKGKNGKRNKHCPHWVKESSGKTLPGRGSIGVEFKGEFRRRQRKIDKRKDKETQNQKKKKRRG